MYLVYSTRDTLTLPLPAPHMGTTLTVSAPRPPKLRPRRVESGEEVTTRGDERRAHWELAGWAAGRGTGWEKTGSRVEGERVERRLIKINQHTHKHDSLYIATMSFT